MLLQFPWSFKNTDEERVYLAKLLEQFSGYPLVLEVRHTSWNNAEFTNGWKKAEWESAISISRCLRNRFDRRP